MGRRTERGVSLPELLVVLAIIALFALIAIPSFRDFLNAFRVKTAAMQVRDTTRLARQMAVARKGLVMTKLTTASGQEAYSGWQELNNPCATDADACQQDSGEETVRPLVVIPQGVKIVKVLSTNDDTLASPIYFRMQSDGTIFRRGGDAGEAQWCIVFEKKINATRTDRWMVTFKLSGKSNLILNPNLSDTNLCKT